MKTGSIYAIANQRSTSRDVRPRGGIVLYSVHSVKGQKGRETSELERQAYINNTAPEWKSELVTFHLKDRRLIK